MRLAVPILLLAMCFAAQARMGTPHRVDDHLYYGRQPAGADFQQLAQMGIRTDLDLRGGPIHKPRERRNAEAAGMRYISIRLSGVWEPHDWQIANALSVLENPSNWPIYLHCWRGDDRVGMVIACYRMHFNHWTEAQAMGEANHDHLNRFELLIRRYIRSFDPSRISVESAARSQ